MPGFSEIVVSFLRFGLLINQLIPISLYVTLEVVKVVQCTFLGWDRHMYHAGKVVPSHWGPAMAAGCHCLTASCCM